jgi:cobalamin biosynthesis Mg chelatase CobN
VHVNSSNNIGRLVAAAAVICASLVFGAAGAQAVSTHAVAASGALAAQESSGTSDSDSQTPSDEESSDNSDATSDSNSDSDTTDSDSDQSTDEPTDEPTFGTPTTGATDDSTEMPTDATGENSEAGQSQSPLGWILLGGGVACAVAAFLVYRRNRNIM